MESGSSEENPRNLWKGVDATKYQGQVTISSIESGEVDERRIYIEDLEKRKEVYGICGECSEPGTGMYWCQACNAKRFKESFENWTSGNKNVDEFIQQSQLNSLSWLNRLEWIPFENFQNVTYIAKGGFGKIYSAEWPGGPIFRWDIENRKWYRWTNCQRTSYKVALKSLNDSSDISADFLHEVRSHLQIYVNNVVPCLGITQDPNTKDYMIVLQYCEHGNLRNYLSKPVEYKTKIKNLYEFSAGLLDIHNSGRIHKDLHSGNVLFFDCGNVGATSMISDLGMSQPANISKEKSIKKEGIFGVLPYVAPEVLRGSQCTKAAEIYSFGIIMNEFMSEEIPYSDIPHDYILTAGICNGLRPNISEDTPKLLADLIGKCWDATPENRPTTKELVRILVKWHNEMYTNDSSSIIYSQIKECEKIRENKLKSRSNESHPEAVYTSRLLSFKGLPEPVNSSKLADSLSSLDLSSFLSGVSDE